MTRASVRRRSADIRRGAVVRLRLCGEVDHGEVAAEDEVANVLVKLLGLSGLVRVSEARHGAAGAGLRRCVRFPGLRGRTVNLRVVIAAAVATPLVLRLQRAAVEVAIRAVLAPDALLEEPANTRPGLALGFASALLAVRAGAAVVRVALGVVGLRLGVLMVALAFALLALLYVLIDLKHWWKGQPFFYAGMNSILLYCGHQIGWMITPLGG